VETNNLFSRNLKNEQFSERAEAQMVDTGQIQYEMVIKRCNCWLL